MYSIHMGSVYHKAKRNETQQKFKQRYKDCEGDRFINLNMLKQHKITKINQDKWKDEIKPDVVDSQWQHNDYGSTIESRIK